MLLQKSLLPCWEAAGPVLLANPGLQHHIRLYGHTICGPSCVCISAVITGGAAFMVLEPQNLSKMLGQILGIISASVQLTKQAGLLVRRLQ